MSSSEYNLNYKTSVLNILYNTFYSKSKLKSFITCYNYVIVLRIYSVRVLQKTAQYGILSDFEGQFKNFVYFHAVGL